MDIVAKLNATLKSLTKLGAEVRELRVDSPAEESALADLEAQIWMPLPDGFRATLATCSSHLEYSWFLQDAIELPEQLSDIFCGQLHWGLDLMLNFVEEYRGWIKEVFPNPEDSYEKVWHNKLPFQEVGNGDFLSIDLSEANLGKIVYLSHDDGEGHGYVLGHSFSDFLTRWIPLGCPGAEDWQWLPFVSSPTSGIEPECENAKIWKSLVFGETTNS